MEKEPALKDLTIDNFRGIKHLEMKDLARINMLVGKNNCGKTSVLEAVHLWTGAAFENMEAGVNLFDLFRQYRIENNVRWLFHKLDVRQNIEITSGEMRLRIWQAEHNRLKLNKYISDKGVDGLKVITFNSDGLLHPATSDIKNKFKFFTKSTYITHSIFYDGFYANMLEITRKDQNADMVTSLSKIDDRVTGILPIEGKIFVKNKDVPEFIPITQMGEGFQRCAAIVAAMANCENGVFLVDEIDTGLHYSALADVWKVVLHTAKALNVQVFATSHSDECIAALFGMLEGEDKAEAALFAIVRGEDEHRTGRFVTDTVEAAYEMHLELR